MKQHRVSNLGKESMFYIFFEALFHLAPQKNSEEVQLRVIVRGTKVQGQVANLSHVTGPGRVLRATGRGKERTDRMGQSHVVAYGN